MKTKPTYSGIIYPNPSMGIVSIGTEKIIKEIVVSNLTEKIPIKKGDVSSSVCSMETDVSPGIYFMQVYGDSNELIFSQRIFKID
jgi:hypothetical protein